MTIKYKKTFENQLLQIVNYIAKELEKLIVLILDNPYKYKLSIYFDDENVRDMIYRGYTINYNVNFKDNLIEVFRIFNKNKPPKNSSILS